MWWWRAQAKTANMKRRVGYINKRQQLACIAVAVGIQPGKRVRATGYGLRACTGYVVHCCGS
jgi:hypothetical protein